MAVAIHTRARQSPYVRDDSVQRFAVPDEKVPWSITWSSYSPTKFEVEKLKTAPWADPCLLKNKDIALKFNERDGKIDRTSFTGKYELDASTGLPLNPMGRTGLIGRGSLGRWGPNHAADPIVTRWKRDATGNPVLDEATGKAILEMAAIRRRDSKEWAIPGGMVDPGEEISVTLKREFLEEALDSNNMTEQQMKQAHSRQDKLFQDGVQVYAGYVDDPRNTDNAWMETVAVNFHDADGQGLGKVPLTSGDDAEAVCWAPINGDMKLYASHKNMVKLVVDRLDAHW